jgi:hypothetical protein
VVVLSTILACTKEAKLGYIPLTPYIKEHFNFKSGSYWIYRDSVSGRKDSFFLKDSYVSDDYFFASRVTDRYVQQKLTVEIMQQSATDSVI